MARSSCSFVIMIANFILLPQFPVISASNDDQFSIIDNELSSFHGDYSPPSPAPPVSPPHLPPISCEDLKGIGKLDSLCMLNTSLGFDSDVYIEGKGSLEIGKGVVVECPNSWCSILVNLTGAFILGENSYIVAGSVKVYADNDNLLEGPVINTMALAGLTPAGIDGAGGGHSGHSGRGATCLVDNLKLPKVMWCGDAYAWSSLDKPDTYGSKGRTSSRDANYGGGGGGKIWFVIGNMRKGVRQWIRWWRWHGGRGGDGYNGSLIEGGLVYVDADLPCELVSGSGNDSLSGATAGGGIIVSADGESFGENSVVHQGEIVAATGSGGGSGGTILLFVLKLGLGKSSTISTTRGHGSFNGGHGGDGKVHFHWSDISVGDEYVPVARNQAYAVLLVHRLRWIGRVQGLPGENGTLTRKACPKGLFGIFCEVAFQRFHVPINAFLTDIVLETNRAESQNHVHRIPVGHQDHIRLVISILLLGDCSLVLLTLLQMYSISLQDLFLALFIFPLGMLFPFPAGISALSCQGSKKSAGLASVYALWNDTSLLNVRLLLENRVIGNL
ncbi:hypothetical protein RJ641_026805 [Dillenia turbinata]|uniref:Uncharacterized protein n=1 Tax=Dillenia turbinata TaxID=194707 RepID=A0AAN8W7L7_9MAGN